MPWSLDAFVTRLGWLIDGAKGWQDLIGALVALFAAFLGARYLDRQTRQAARIEADRKERARAAVRAALPLWLSAICEYANDMASGLRPLALAPGESVPRAMLVSFSPVLPAPELINNLQKTIESETNMNVVRAISEALSEIQVLNARTRDISKPATSLIVTKSNIETYLLQAAKLYAIASSLFPYARRQSEEVEAVVGLAELHVALRVLDLDGPPFARLAEMADRTAAENQR